jgi:hypothetical protein
MTEPKLYRLKNIIGTDKTRAMIPVSRTAWYLGQKAGIYPLGRKIGTGSTKVYASADIEAVIAGTYQREAAL